MAENVPTPTAVESDVASDAKGEVRATAPTPTPPGTTAPTFWERAGTRAAVVATAFAIERLGLTPLVMDTLGSDAALVISGVYWSWLAAFGFHKIDADDLRWR